MPPDRHPAPQQLPGVLCWCKAFHAFSKPSDPLANPQKGVWELFGTSGKFSRLDALGENGVPSRWFPKGKGYCVAQTGRARRGGEGGSRAIKSRGGFSNPLRAASQPPTVT